LPALLLARVPRGELALRPRGARGGAARRLRLGAGLPPHHGGRGAARAGLPRSARVLPPYPVPLPGRVRAAAVGGGSAARAAALRPDRLPDRTGPEELPAVRRG